MQLRLGRGVTRYRDPGNPVSVHLPDCMKIIHSISKNVDLMALLVPL